MPAVIESHGAAVVVRPTRAARVLGAVSRLTLADVADVAGNPLPATGPLTFSTPAIGTTLAPCRCTVVAGESVRADRARCDTGPLRRRRERRRRSTSRSRSPRTRPCDVAFSQPLSAELGHARHGVQRRQRPHRGGRRRRRVHRRGARHADRPRPLASSSSPTCRGPPARTTASRWSRAATRRATRASCAACSAPRASIRSAARRAATPAARTSSIDFTGDRPSTEHVPVRRRPRPFTDINGSGFIDGREVARDENRAALQDRRARTARSVGASFNGADCVPVDARERELHVPPRRDADRRWARSQQNCTLPDGTTVAVVHPGRDVAAGDVRHDASRCTRRAVISIDTDTGTAIMRMREPAVAARSPATSSTRAACRRCQVALDALHGRARHEHHAVDPRPALASRCADARGSGDVPRRTAGSRSASRTSPTSRSRSTIYDAARHRGAVDLIVPQGEMKLQLSRRP